MTLVPGKLYHLDATQRLYKTPGIEEWQCLCRIPSGQLVLFLRSSRDQLWNFVIYKEFIGWIIAYDSSLFEVHQWNI